VNPARPTPAITLSDFCGQPALHLRAGDGASACVLLHGAHLVSWVPAGGEEQLYLSPRAVLDGHQAVRGGVPVIFPQFNQRGPLPRHGFARNRAWRALSLEQGADDALAVLRLVDDEDTRALWPVSFVAELSLRITGARLDIELAVEHRESDEAGPPAEVLGFSAALHTYLRVGDAPSTRLTGLQRLRYEDSVRGTQQVDMGAQLAVEGELDRIYFDVARPLRLEDGARRVEIAAVGFPDVVVWNPGAEACARISDMPPEGWREMLCVEAAAIGTPVRLPPGDCWIGRQTLTVLGPDDEPAGR
jgi:glucose-6-phosphate 1-epimerase